ncbi:hypothetical protein BC937DRAFT_94491, partial [Endogone sp. FLAS-F59071]
MRFISNPVSSTFYISESATSEHDPAKYNPLSIETSDVGTQMMAFGILLKTVNAWGGSVQQLNQASATENTGLGQPLPGFEQFMFENIVR